MTAPLFRYISDKPMWASYAYVGLAAPGGVGSWERDAMVKFTELLFVYTMIQLNIEGRFCLRLRFFFLFDRFQGYQFWVQANEEGHFLIENIRAGHYNLYAWVPGIVGDCRYDVIIHIQPGKSKKVFFNKSILYLILNIKFSSQFLLDLTACFLHGKKEGLLFHFDYFGMVIKTSSLS